MHTIHEKLLLDTAQFPRAGESNSYLLEFIDQFAMDLDLIDASGYHMMGYIEVRLVACQRRKQNSHLGSIFRS